MQLFGPKLVEVESHLFENLKKTKGVFPEEIQLIEFGLVLMRDVTQITKGTVEVYPKKPNLYTNHNLFARNRQLLLNAYLCLLFSSYGTEFVLLRTVLENNNLMRLFNKNPQLAFDWLPIEKQKQFAVETQLIYGKSGNHDKKYGFSPVADLIFEDIRKAKVKAEIWKFYGELCNYTHPNFVGWQELMGQVGEVGVIQNMPLFSSQNCENATGMVLFLMQMSFKTFVETFKGYLAGFACQLEEWQNRFNKTMLKFTDSA